jgi:integrase
MAVFKRKTSTGGERWAYRTTMRFPDGHTQRISGVPTLDTKAAAEDALRDHVDRLLHPPSLPAPAAPVPSSVLFKDFAADWLKTYPSSAGNRVSTQTAHEQHCRVHLIPMFGEMPLDQIDSQAVARIFADLSKTTNGTITKATAKPLSPTTVRNIGATLHKILTCALQWGKLPQGMPIWPKRKLAHTPWDFYTAEESGVLLEAAKRETDEARTAILFALRTGARAGELLAVEWGDLDFVGHRAHFRRSLHDGIEGPTKTGHGRVVPLSPELEGALKKIQHLRGPKVFCRLDGGPLALGQLDHILKRVQRRAGLRRIRWHDLRHSFASQCMIAGVQIKQVQEWLGHSTITMTMRYAHLAPNADKVSLVALLDQANGGR